MPDWPGIICPRCRAVLDFATESESMGLWVYRDYPETSLIQMHCRFCNCTCNIYLGESWEEDCKYLSSIGLGCIVHERSPVPIREGYRQTFGFDALSKSHLAEILFFAHLLSNQYDEWWNEVSYDGQDG